MKQTIKNILQIAKNIIKKETSGKQDKSKTTSKIGKSTEAQEQIEAKRRVAFAKKNKVSTPFFWIEGCTSRTSDGKIYSTMEELYADGYLDDQSNVTILPGKYTR